MLKRISLALVLVLAAALTWSMWPETGRADVSGLVPAPGEYDATILRDRWGVPHVRGVSDADAAYGLAYAHAEDDFETIQLTLLAARGELATVAGVEGAPLDYLHGLLKVSESVAAGWTVLDEDTRAVLDGYADGLNHYAAVHPDDTLPGLFPASGRDIVASFVQKAPLFFGIDQVFQGLFSEERPELRTVRSNAGRYGSNVIAVSPRRSHNGETMLLSNSHQPWTGALAWYEAHVTSDEGWDMTGALLPGMPVVAIGHNRDLGWSFTVNRPDLIDVYLLETNPDDPDQYRLDGEWVSFERYDVPIEIRLFGRVRWTVQREALWSAFGPVVRADHGVYAVRYAGMGEVGMVEQLYDMNRAATFEDWRAAVEAQSGLASFNIGYADRTGRIAYTYNGMFPARDPAFDWAGYVPGASTRVIWHEYMPARHNPWLIDPASGYIQNANSSPYGVTSGSDVIRLGTFPDSMGIETHETNRSVRASELLGADDSITQRELRAIKYDQQYDPAALPMRLRQLILSASWAGDLGLAEAIETVQGWEGSVDEADRGAALVMLTLAALFGEGAEFDPSQLIEADLLVIDLESAFRATVADLLAAHGRVDPQWGEVNRIVRGDTDIGIGGGPDVLHAIYGEAVDGRLEGVAGDSYILLAVWDDAGAVESFSIHQFGSATVDELSPHYADQVSSFAGRRLKPVWYDESDIRANLEREYRPGEGAGERADEPVD